MFTIDPDNNIMYGQSTAEAGTRFESLEQLEAIATDRGWSKASVTGVWNGFAGTPAFSDLKIVQMFRNRPYGLAQIWKAIQRLAPADAATGPETAATDTVESMPKAKKTKKKAAKPAVKKASKVATKRDGGKRDELIRLVSRKNGASGQEIQDALGWQPHSVRGAISTINSKGVAKIESEKHETRGRVYRIAS